MIIYIKSKLRELAIWYLQWTEYCPVCRQSWSIHSCPGQVLSTRVCDICEQPLTHNAVKTHEGKWRCAIHKES